MPLLLILMLRKMIKHDLLGAIGSHCVSNVSTLLRWCVLVHGRLLHHTILLRSYLTRRLLWIVMRQTWINTQLIHRHECLLLKHLTLWLVARLIEARLHLIIWRRPVRYVVLLTRFWLVNFIFVLSHRRWWLICIILITFCWYKHSIMLANALMKGLLLAQVLGIVLREFLLIS